MSTRTGSPELFFDLHLTLEKYHLTLEALWDSLRQPVPQDNKAQYHQLISERLSEWNGLLGTIQQALNHLPRELAHRDRIRSFCDYVEELQSRAVAYLSEIQVKLSREWDLAQVGQGFFSDFFSEVRELKLEFKQFQSHGLMQRYMAGNKVLASRTQFQWGRKVFHVATGLAGLCFYRFSGLSAEWSLLVLSALLFTGTMIEVMRAVSPAFNDRLGRMISGIMREREKTQISSGTWYMVSSLIVLWIFPTDIAFLAIFYLAVGDTAAGIAGTQWGKHKMGEHASWEGFLAGWFVNFLGGYAYLTFAATDPRVLSLTSSYIFLVATVGALVGSLSEVVIRNLDDNLVIPLTSAPLILLLLYILSL